MPPRGKFSGRRGSIRGRGGKSGRGNAKRSFGGAQKFNTTRLDAVEESGSENAEEAPSSDVGDESESSVSDVEDVPATTQPYIALMQSLAKDSASSAAPSAKRRKLDHQSKKEVSSATQNQNEDDDVSDGEGRDVDLVEEPEEEPGDDIELEGDDGDDDVPDDTDPFETHFVNPDSAVYNKRLKGIQSNAYTPQQQENNGWRIFRSIPGQDPGQINQPPTIFTGPSDLKLKHRLLETTNKLRPSFDKLEQVLYPITFGYQDLLFCGRSPSNSESLRRMACLHAVNHIFKTRDRVIKNNARLAKEGEATNFEPRDQGFTRPKVLMILPTREAAAKAVEAICAACEPDQQENRKRFDESYVDREAKFSADKPADFRELFEGNDDDMFRIGVKFTRKTVKYFAQFYNSDILLASPLGLRMAMGSEGDKRKVDFDFLSSVELVLVDHADALLNQNWEHVEHIFDHLNRQPLDAHGCDFSRVREWYLEGHAAHFRQTVVFSAFNTPELAELHRRGANWAGRARVQPEYAGAIQDLGAAVRVKQTFSRFEAPPSVADEPDARFAYFTSAVVPSLLKLAGGGVGGSRRGKSGDAANAGGTLIFIPSYLDFVRVRNYFSTAPAVEGLSFGAVSEYAGVREASRARSHFLSGRHRVLLYTERAHHFRRYLLAGVRRVVMYAPPDNPVFYREVAGGFLARAERDALLDPGRGAVRVLFSRYDVLRLERIVGSARVAKMIRDRGDTFDFV
ncbi:putative U3 small nucleolar RNA-associated protein 25 [Rosellinia necatrix]|uniref:U3 small nucleolar RNA-associated protein 25 n=1 Tax=Rosellinia necatrix TaxID=77044 RepID=A0A1S7UIS0_ROSNE|nr:putative U3 small nucleolar RNA-associated protein 25 [Rosellinia necatrix]